MAELPSGSDSELPSGSPLNLPNTQSSKNGVVPDIPTEIVSEEEMALIEAALATTRSSLSSSAFFPSICSPSRSSLLPSQFERSTRSIQSITHLSKRSLSGCTDPDIEDLGNLRSPQKKNCKKQSFLYRFRKKRGLSVTDITAAEWCEKKLEFVLLFDRPRANKAMRAGHARHLELEKEVVRKFKVHTKSFEDKWALKLLNFITGANQLLFEGLTRELPIVSFVEGVWMVGVIDEIRMPLEEVDKSPILVDTKTRVRDTLPSEPQMRNGRLQLMCYKYLWDNLVADNFPSAKFFDFFSLDPHSILSEEIRENIANLGVLAQTLDDMVRYYRNTSSVLAPAHNQLILRYELQKNRSVLSEVPFEYDSNWLKSQLHDCLELWMGEREASYTLEEERWKCRYCNFASVCPGNPNPNVSKNSSTSTSSSSSTS